MTSGQPSSLTSRSDAVYWLIDVRLRLILISSSQQPLKPDISKHTTIRKATCTRLTTSIFPFPSLSLILFLRLLSELLLRHLFRLLLSAFSETINTEKERDNSTNKDEGLTKVFIFMTNCSPRRYLSVLRINKSDCQSVNKNKLLTKTVILSIHTVCLSCSLP